MHQTLVRGQGELHLDVTLEKIKRRFHVDVELAKPKVPYRETIKAKAQGEYRHKKQTGGRGQFGEVHLRLEPTKRGEASSSSTRSRAAWCRTSTSRRSRRASSRR